MKVSYNMVSDVYGYGAEKTSQPPTKPYVIPSQEEIASEKTATQTAIDNNYDPFEAAETGSVSLPEWMQTKTTPKRSDAEILKDIEALAKEHAKTGQFQDSDPRFKALMDEYVSSVSPDRESILKNSTNEINERIASELAELAKIMAGMAKAAEEDAEKEVKKKNEELIDYLMEAIYPKKGKNKEKNDADIISNFIATRGNNIATGNDGIIASRSGGDYTATDIDRGDGKTTTLVYDNQGNAMPWMSMKSDTYNANVMNGVVESAFFYDDNGNMIMNYNKGRLTQTETNAEFTKRKELQAVYNAVYDFSIGRYNSHEKPNTDGKTVLTNINGIKDAGALIKEVYDSTYERLRNEMLSSGVA